MDNDNIKKIEKEKIKNEARINKYSNINLKGFTKFGLKAEKSICKIKIPPNNSYGTGFFCKIPYPDEEHILKVLLTNNHVLNKEYLCAYKEIQLEINNEKISLPLDKERKIWTNKEIDYTIIEILSSDNITNFLTIDENINMNTFQNKEYNNESILLPSFMRNGEIETDKGIIELAKEKSLFLHNCNTDDGSSGGPVILIDNFSVIGMHIGYLEDYKKNVGIFIKNIITDIKTQNILKLESIGRIIIEEPLNPTYLLKTDTVMKIFQKCEKSICKIFINRGIGFGFFCNIPIILNNTLKVLITCDHILNQDDIKLNKKIKLSVDNKYYEILINNERRVYTNVDDDIAIIEIKEEDKLDNIAPFDINDGIFEDNSLGREILKIGFRREKMDFSIGKIRSLEGSKFSFDAPFNFNSGTPILNIFDFQVIGMSIYATEKYQIGLFLNESVEKFEKKFRF